MPMGNAPNEAGVAIDEDCIYSGHRRSPVFVTFELMRASNSVVFTGARHMIEPILWPSQDGDPTGGGPFHPDSHGRSLRLTIHSQSCVHARGTEVDAFGALSELARWGLADVIATDPTEQAQRLEIEIGDPPAQIVVGKHVDANGDVRAARLGPIRLEQQLGRTTSLDSDDRGGHSVDSPSLGEGFWFAQTHAAFKRDVFVTVDPGLLGAKNAKLLRQANLRTPSEAVRILALLLHSREKFIYAQRHLNWSSASNRWGHYFVLTQRLLPGMRALGRLCNSPEDSTSSELRELSTGVLERSSRALQARDFIGAEFYVPRNADSAELMMYHLDYLTLLLAGALDALAQIVNVAHGRIESKVINIGFRKDKFVRKLQASGSSELYKLVSLDRTKAILDVLHQYRNTIHSASPTMVFVGNQFVGLPDSSYLNLSSDQGRAFQHSATVVSTLHHWGLSVEEREVHMEPYSFASTLVDECLGVINAIANSPDLLSRFSSYQRIGADLYRLSGLDTFDEVAARRFLTLN